MPPPGGGGAPPMPGAGAAPPGMGGPPKQPGGTGAATVPRPQMGNAASSLTLVHTALEALQKALPGLPMGSELHTAVLRTVTDLSKRLGNEPGDKASQVQQLAQMGRGLQANPQAAALQRLQGGGAPQPPAMPG
jgi:hypothetical protein